jgi:hypothetical protein
MRRLLLSTVLASLAVPGCQFFVDKRQATPPPLKVAPQPAVTADDVTATNAHEKARALNDEMERECDGEEVK